jgi:hypothetical protein
LGEVDRRQKREALAAGLGHLLGALLDVADDIVGQAFVLLCVAADGRAPLRCALAGGRDADVAVQHVVAFADRLPVEVIYCGLFNLW